MIFVQFRPLPQLLDYLLECDHSSFTGCKKSIEAEYSEIRNRRISHNALQHMKTTDDCQVFVNLSNLLTKGSKVI